MTTTDLGMKPQGARGQGPKWSRLHSACIDCGTMDRKHEAHGRCRSCLLKHQWRNDQEWRTKQQERDRARPPRGYHRNQSRRAKRTPVFAVLPASPEGSVCISAQDGQWIVIDLADRPLVSQYTWRTSRNSDGNVYAVTTTKPRLALHRLLMCPAPEQSIDHINGNGLDNRRCNLRLCTTKQNSANRKLSKNNTTGYKGVWHDKRDGRFCACIGTGGRSIKLGRFAKAEDAARAYNAAAIKYFGEFARLNVISEVQP